MAQDFTESLDFQVQFSTAEAAADLRKEVAQESERLRQQDAQAQRDVTETQKKRSIQAQEELVDRRKDLFIRAIDDQEEREKAVIRETFKAERRRIQELLELRKQAGDITQAEFDQTFAQFDKGLRQVRDQSLSRLQTGAAGARREVQGLAQNLSFVIQDAPFGIIGLSNNLDPLVASFRRAKSSAGGLTGVLKGLLSPAGLITIGASIVIALATAFSDDLVAAFRSSNEELKAFKSELEGVLDLSGDVGGDPEAIEKQIDALTAASERLREEQERLADADGSSLSRFLVGLQADFGDILAEQGLDRETLAGPGVGLETQAEAEQLETLAARRERIEAIQEAVQEEISALRARNEALRIARELRVPTQDRAGGDAPRRPRAPVVEVQDTLIDQDAVDLDAALDLDALAELELRLQAIQRLQAGGIFTDLEADRQRLEANRRALARLQREAAEGGDVESATTDRLRARIEELEERLGDVGDTAEDELSLGLVAATTAFQTAMGQAIGEITSQIESDFARAIVQAVLQATASAAVDDLIEALKGDDGTLIDIFGTGQQSSSPAQGFSFFGGGSGGSGGASGAGALAALSIGSSIGQGARQAGASRVISGLAGGASSALLAAAFGLGPLGIAGLGVAGLLGGLFEEGGYTGDASPSTPAGIVHGGEVVMEAPIVSGQESEWMALRSLAQQGVRVGDLLAVSGYADGGLVSASQPRVNVEVGGQGDVVRALQRVEDRLDSALTRPAQATFSPREFRRGQEGTARRTRSKSPRTRR